MTGPSNTDGVSNRGSPSSQEPQRVGHGPFDRQVRWAGWWIILFVAITAGLLTWMAVRAPFLWWAIAAALLWLPMELFGAFRSATDPYPPLTQITREYVPRWVTFTVIYASAALAGGTWFHFRHRWWLAALGGLLGWLTTHFDVTYDAPAVRQENIKYRWYADKLGLGKFSARLQSNQRAREIAYGPKNE